MSTNDKKDKNEELFDHIIKYGASSWADDISPDDIPEEDLSDQLNQKWITCFPPQGKGQTENAGLSQHGGLRLYLWYCLLWLLLL